MILSGEGPVHTDCHKSHLIVTGKRTFMNLHFPSISLNDLYEMKEMLLIEINARDRISDHQSGDIVELF